VTAAWTVVQIAELVRAGEELLLQALHHLDPDARTGMPDDGAWTLSGEDAGELRTLLIQHHEIAEHLHMLAERLPEHGVIATYGDVRDGAADALAEGILDPDLLMITAWALDVQAGWAALATSLASTDVRASWSDLEIGQLLGSFRHADRRLVRRVLDEAKIEPDAQCDELAPERAARLASVLHTYAGRA
jgi:hypothetical protein